MKKLKYSWNRFDRESEIVYKRIIGSGYSPNTVIALARGGLILGVKISHYLKKPLMIISAKTYSDEKKILDTVILNTSYTAPLKSPVLICDELADSGKTLKVITSHFETLGVELKTATLLYKPHSKVRPDFYGSIVPNDKWIVFPWEVE